MFKWKIRCHVSLPGPFRQKGTPFQRWAAGRGELLGPQPSPEPRCPLQRWPPCPQPVTRQTLRAPTAAVCGLGVTTSAWSQVGGQGGPALHPTCLGFLTLCTTKPPPQLVPNPPTTPEAPFQPPSAAKPTPAAPSRHESPWIPAQAFLSPCPHFCLSCLSGRRLWFLDPSPSAALVGDQAAMFLVFFFFF